MLQNLLRSRAVVPILFLALPQAVSAASLIYDGHSRSVSAETYNTHYLPGFGTDTAGALPGADDTLATSNPGATLIINETLGYGPDIFGRINKGSMTAVTSGSADRMGHVVNFNLNPTIAGEAAPQVTLSGESSTRFTVDEDTDAAIFASFHGSIPGTSDQVSAVLIEFDPLTDERTRFVFNLAGKFSGVDVSDAGAFDVSLRADREYELLVSANARANIPTDFSDNQRPSDIVVAIAPGQDASGTTEADALKPSTTVKQTADPGATHLFMLDSDSLISSETVWLDPAIATGFSYDIFGAVVNELVMPSLASVNDPDGFEIWSNGTLLTRATAEERISLPGLSGFELRGIDPALALDPDAPGAFVLGFGFDGVTGQNVTVRQTALTSETAAVPLPAGLALLLSALWSVGLLRRR